MLEVTLTAETGRPLGTRPSRRLRAAGRIPAVVYGLGGEPVSVSIDRGDLRRALSTEAGANALVRLAVDGGNEELTIVKELQRHPVRQSVTHVDFLRIDRDAPITVDVPIVLTGEAKQVGAQNGIVQHNLTSLTLTATPLAVPVDIKIDVSGMDLDTVVTVADLDLPEGCTTEVDPEAVVVNATLTRAALVAAMKARQGAGGDEAPAQG